MTAAYGFVCRPLLDALRAGIQRDGTLVRADYTHVEDATLYRMLARMVATGEAVQLSRGLYALPQIAEAFTALLPEGSRSAARMRKEARGRAEERAKR